MGRVVYNSEQTNAVGKKENVSSECFQCCIHLTSSSSIAHQHTRFLTIWTNRLSSQKSIFRLLELKENFKNLFCNLGTVKVCNS